MRDGGRQKKNNKNKKAALATEESISQRWLYVTVEFTTQRQSFATEVESTAQRRLSLWVYFSV